MTTPSDKFFKLANSNDNKSPEWYTPRDIIEDACAAMGVDRVDLDPASCVEANQYVGARRFFTEADNGLLQEWHSPSVFLNPPSGRSPKGGQEVWQKKLLAEYHAGRTEQAVMLVYRLATGPDWFHQIAGKYPICLLRGRIKFIPPVGKYEKVDSKPMHDSAILYVGKYNERFASIFRKRGYVIMPDSDKLTGCEICY